MQRLLPNWQNMVDYGALAARLRELRKARRWTLNRASHAAALTASTLSRIETNRRVPSIEHLVALSGAYGVSLSDLLPPSVSDPRVRSATRRVDGMVVRMLSTPGSATTVLEITLYRRARRRKPQTHAGREWLYVVSGVLALRLGETDMVLREGEAAEFDTRLPHALDAESDSLTLIAIFSEEGQHIHLRAH